MLKPDPNKHGRVTSAGITGYTATFRTNNFEKTGIVTGGLCTALPADDSVIIGIVTNIEILGDGVASRLAQSDNLPLEVIADQRMNRSSIEVTAVSVAYALRGKEADPQKSKIIAGVAPLPPLSLSPVCAGIYVPWWSMDEAAQMPLAPALFDFLESGYYITQAMQRPLPIPFSQLLASHVYYLKRSNLMNGSEFAGMMSCVGKRLESDFNQMRDIMDALVNAGLDRQSLMVDPQSIYSKHRARA